MRHSIGLLVGALLMSVTANASHAQSSVSPPLTSAVRITVVDSAGAGIPAVQVIIRAGRSSVIASGLSDESGTLTLRIPSSGDLEAVARRIGYQPHFQFFTAFGAPIALRVQLARSVVSLEAVNVTAAIDHKRHSYHLGADEIAASTRLLDNALDVLAKLRPDMADPRTPSTSIRPCTAENIIVNGRWIRYVPPDEANLQRVVQQRGALAAGNVARASSGEVSGLRAIPTGPAMLPISIQATLLSIRPEHIEELNYADCDDVTMEDPHSRNAVIVVLKPGVDFQPGVGSFVRDAELPIAANRLRLVGVFDESGTALSDVEIIDVASGMSVKTSDTGNATLAFLPDGAHALRIHKAGYADQSLDVHISEKELTPITLVLAPAG